MGSLDRGEGAGNFEHQPCMVTKESRIESTLQMLLLAIRDSWDEPWILGWTKAMFERSPASTSLLPFLLLALHCSIVYSKF